MCHPSPPEIKLSRLIFLIILFGVGYLLYHLYGKKLLRQGPKSLIKPALIALLVIVLAAVATGRANAIFAVLGGLLTLAWRAGPLLLRFLPQIRQILNRFGVQSTGSTGSSRVNTATLSMTLNHRTGRIDGDIIAGQFNGRTLSSLSFDEIRQLHSICQQQDIEAVRLIEAFIEREFPDKWQEKQWSRSSESSANNSAAITIEEAWETLGLTPGSSREDVIHAHRKLMSRLHPDKGGSTFLATRVNQAKDRILAELD